MSAKKYDNNKKPSNGSFVVSCVGSGRKNDGCGYMGGKSGYQCPKCGGMLLSSIAIMDAKMKKVENFSCSIGEGDI